MPNVMPQFKFHYVDISGRRILCIETGGRVIHEIHNLTEFYHVFGYRVDPNQTDVLPDEFIWSEYVNNSDADYNSCIQMHVIEYLKKHSDTFNTEFGGQYESWIAEHAKARSQGAISCIACRLNPDRKI